MHQCIKCIIDVTALYDVMIVHNYDYLPGDIYFAYICVCVAFLCLFVLCSVNYILTGFFSLFLSVFLFLHALVNNCIILAYFCWFLINLPV